MFQKKLAHFAATNFGNYIENKATVPNVVYDILKRFKYYLHGCY